MKYIITLIAVLVVQTTVLAQKTASSPTIKYAVVVSFGSICCGPASDDFLKSFIKTYNKKNKLSINGFQLGGCGREGEFKILFSLPRLKQVKKQKFLKTLNSLVSNQNDKNKTANHSSGNIELTYNVRSDEISNCRGELVKWK